MEKCTSYFFLFTDRIVDYWSSGNVTVT